MSENFRNYLDKVYYYEDEFERADALFPNLTVDCWDNFYQWGDITSYDIVEFYINYILDFQYEVIDIYEDSREIKISCDYLEDLETAAELLLEYGWSISNYEELKNILINE